MEFEYDIFISYSSEDKNIARRLEAYLMPKYKVWRDEREIAVGNSIITKISDAIPKARYVAILLTNNAIKSNWVAKEISAAITREMEEKRDVALPILHESCKIPVMLKDKKYADFTENFDDGIKALTSLLDEYTQQGKELPTPTPLPQSEDRRTLEQEREKLLNFIMGGEDLFLAMDLGGTKAYLALVNRQAERLYNQKFLTENHKHPQKLLGFIKNCIWQTIDGIAQRCDTKEVKHEVVLQKIKALGIGFPGPTDYENGIVLDASNFTIKNFPLVAELRKTFNFPIFIDNDVNLGVLGEAWLGAAQGHKNVVGIIIGTGIGGGIVIDSKIYRGKNMTAGEIGHMIVDYNMIVDQQSTFLCGCGQTGCFEALASRQAMMRKLIAIKNAKNELPKYWREGNIGSNEIADEFKLKDPDAVQVVMEAAAICGKAVFSILNLLNPDIIFFGGGFIQQLGEDFLPPVWEEAKKCMNAVYSVKKKPIPIVIGKLDNPILVGACKLILDSLSEQQEESQPKDCPEKTIVADLIKNLDGNARENLATIYNKGSIYISQLPTSSFSEDELRILRNRGLIETEEGLSFKNSKHARLTTLGQFITEEIIRSQKAPSKG